MFESLLLINVGDDPDRPRPGRSWLKNLYRVHQRLAMAFPQPERKARDPQFIEAFDREDFPLQNVHVKRSAQAGFLFRLDPQPGASPKLLVRSAQEPDWDYAFQNTSFLAAPAMEKSIQWDLQENMELRFRLLANPTIRLKETAKRIAVAPEQLEPWLHRKSQKAGFGLDATKTHVVNTQWRTVIKTETKLRFFTARYEGILTVTDPEKLAAALEQGIGPAKAFGCGLLSVAPG